MGMNYSLPESFTSYRDTVRIELRKLIDDCPPALRDMLRYHMGWQDERGRSCDGESGKFVRSSLCLLSCEVVGGDISQVMPAAAAVELIHNFSLIHDDIQDASCERHHRPTVWRLWGQPQAINAGDAMLTLAYVALLKLREKGVPDEKSAISTQMLTLACLELCEGQYLDLEYENRFDVTVEDYLNMAAKKTAALLGVSASLGAYLGNECSGLVDCLRIYGKELGIAYQIRDDIIGIWGVKESAGKSAGDISRRKKALPVVYGLQNSRGAEKERLEELYAQESIEGGDIAEVRRLLEELGARDYAENLGEQYYCRALAQLAAGGLDASRQAPLREAACFLVKRNF